MKKTYIIILIAILTLSSCGKSKEELELEKAKMELEKTKLELAETNKANKQYKVSGQTAEMQKFHEQKSILGEQNILTEMNEQLNEISTSGNKLKNGNVQLNDSIKFDFLKSPKSLMNYIFKSAKSGDFSNFHVLCDPYGENDSDTKEICSMARQSPDQKEEFIASFANGKIIGEPKIIGDRAEIEFRFGPTSSNLETMYFINRNGLWFLDSF